MDEYWKRALVGLGVAVMAYLIALVLIVLTCKAVLFLDQVIK